MQSLPLCGYPGVPHAVPLCVVAPPGFQLPQNSFDLRVCHPGVVAQVESELLVLGSDPVVRTISRFESNTDLRS